MCEHGHKAAPRPFMLRWWTGTSMVRSCSRLRRCTSSLAAAADAPDGFCELGIFGRHRLVRLLLLGLFGLVRLLPPCCCPLSPFG